MNLQRYDYKILVIGLGSMGKRRIRNLKTMGFTNIYGCDTREDRVKEAVELYNITVVSNGDNVIATLKPEVLIISVPPDAHHIYMNKAIEAGIHFFVEASVVDDGMDDIILKLKKKDIIAAPSSTLYFHPAIRKISDMIQNGELGNITNFVYHSGQYLPDWHTYENVRDFYVSKKETGGAREIVPFELTWITKILGFPEYVAGTLIKGAAIEGAEEIDDTYNALLSYKGFVLNLVIDVVSRHATRKLLINGTQKQLIWDWDVNCIKIYDSTTAQWTSWDYQVNASAAGFNKNITEQIYVDELTNFFEAIEKKATFFNSMEYDHRVLKLLYTIENSWTNKRIEHFTH